MAEAPWDVAAVDHRRLVPHGRREWIPCAWICLDPVGPRHSRAAGPHPQTYPAHASPPDSSTGGPQATCIGQRAAVAKGHESETGRKKQLAAQNGTNESQQRRVPVNPESSSNKFTPEEDAVTGFPMDPLVVDNGHAHRVPLINDGRSSSTLGRSSGTDPNAQRFYTSQIAAAEMSNPSTATGHQGNTGEWHKEEPNPVLRTIDASRGKHGRDP
ncbi:uncharacterized protein LOC123425851 isoform X1 [Hordeum vulgare subsp. vulgare]|nr:uncharacterized protein LOC123425851 isoform X1 [Hordeum vulgare subsp. vulgare]